MTLNVQAPYTQAGDAQGSGSEMIDLRGVVRAVWRRKWIVVGSMLAGAILAAMLVSQVSPRYTAQASVMLDPRTVQVLAADDLISDLDINDPLLDTEVAVIRSNLLLGDVLDALPPHLVETLDPANQAPGMMTVLRRGISRTVSAVTGPLLGSSGDDGPVAAPLLTEEEQRRRRLVGEIGASLNVQRDGRSYVISVNAETGDPELSTVLANTVVASYIDAQVGQRTAAARDAIDFLVERVEELEAEVEAAETAVETYRASQLAEAGISLEALEQQLLDLSTQLSLARADAVTAEARVDRVQSIIETDGPGAAAEIVSSPFVLQLRSELAALERQDADLATSFGPSRPERQALRASIARLSDDIAAEIDKVVGMLRNEAEVARIRVRSLQQSLSELESRAAEVSRTSLNLRQLEREAEAVRQTYETTLERLSQTSSFDRLQRPDARVIREAVIPSGPSAPRTSLFTALGGTLGLSAGLIAVFVMSVTGAGYSNASQVERATGLPVLSALPKGRWRNRARMLRTLREDGYQIYAERIRQLRLGIRSLGQGSEPRSVVITSSTSREGKTTTAVALAHLEGRTGRSCILLDFELRRSALAREFGYAPRSGDLGAALAGDCALEDAIHVMPDMGFDLLTSRTAAPDLIDRTTLLQLETLLRELTAQYDLIVIDTPPLLHVADAVPLAQIADATILLIREEVTRGQAVASSLRLLRKAGVDRIGAALSMTDLRREEDLYGVSTARAYGP
jgi:uncharacterized protein involved in exopolysaccharide biosynthesis/MinD-like ATPase involved in chromosome partitioning or flagellar assembly